MLFIVVESTTVVALQPPRLGFLLCFGHFNLLLRLLCLLRYLLFREIRVTFNVATLTITLTI